MLNVLDHFCLADILHGDVAVPLATATCLQGIAGEARRRLGTVLPVGGGFANRPAGETGKHTVTREAGVRRLIRSRRASNAPRMRSP